MRHTFRIPLPKARDFAQELAEQLRGHEVLALIGPLGSGKTTFSKALGKALKVTAPINSPTFVIFNRYNAKLKNKKIFLYHADLYRTKTFSEIETLGLPEIWNKPGTVTVIEWANKIKKYLPKNTVYIYFRHEKKSARH